MRTRSLLSLPFALLAAALLASAGPASAAPAPSSPPSYSNPMRLTLPSGGQAASCADPFVLHGAAKSDRNWYLYCTTDALSATEKDTSGNLVFHQVPTYRSTDLTHWTYVNDAFPVKPSWLASDGGVWAPDVVYRDGTYFLYYTASNTSLPGGGSAIGVATSKSPTGPWTDTGTPVVPPNGRWQFDPEVISVGTTQYIYFGSYFGGVHVRQLSSDGLSSVASSERQIAIDNRYEGTFIVQHDGWYYFMGSASNCCAGPLTGYSVFTARSRSPLGPFLDRDGVSILANRVGGTPVLSQNGNRWVGAGHNAVVTDFSGQDWIVYHAVDQGDPYYAGTTDYTKRPALIDPLDWGQDGWPVVRGDRGPSDAGQPGPAAQPGQQGAYTPSFAAPVQAGTPMPALSDEFSGSHLSGKWTWVRPPATDTYDVTGGSFAWKTQAGDIHPPDTNLASVLTEPAPSGDYVVEAKVSVNTPNSDAVQNYVQGGLIVYKDDGHYVRLTSNSIWNTRQTEFGIEVYPAAVGPNYGNGVVGPVGDWTYLRIVHTGTDHYTAYTSLDGQTWDKGDTWNQALGSKAKIGLISLGGVGFTTSVDYVRVSPVTSGG